jgi:hypothetical protein
MIIKNKYYPDGTLNKVKARLVAGGHRQPDGSYTETVSPTIEHSSIYVIIVMASYHRLDLYSADVPSAYLNAMLQEEVLLALEPRAPQVMLELDEDYRNYLTDKGTIIVQLKKSIYGLKQSSANWYTQLMIIVGKILFLPWLRTPTTLPSFDFNFF